ncbi:MAG: hypothetical protein ABIO70_32405 [Pseudomonadota bacterium]
MRPLCLLPALFACACASAVDRFTLEHVIPSAGSVGDVDRACALGAALGHALLSLGRPGHRAEVSLLMADTMAGFCSEGEAWEAELAAARGMVALNAGNTGLLPEVEDSRLREARAHQQAAARFLAAWGHLQILYGPVGEGSCPALPGDEGILYLLGMYAGVNALLHDRASGGTLGVPLDIPAAVARGTLCVDDEQWWHAPAAMHAAAEAMLPGLAPEGSDPWANLEIAAAASEPTGVRLGRGLQVLISANAGREDEVRRGIQAHAVSLGADPQQVPWALLDEYARIVSLHEADLLWTTATGHRAPALGPLPDAAPAVAPPDPFAGDDPFGVPALEPEP